MLKLNGKSGLRKAIPSYRRLGIPIFKTHPPCVNVKIHCHKEILGKFDLKTYDQSCNFQNELQGNSHFQGFRKTHVSDFRICSKTGFWSLWTFVGFWIYCSLANRLELKGTYSVHISLLFSSKS